MKIKTSDIQAIAVKEDQYPADQLPEFAFVGRSNVGKSSFINSMLNRKNLARTSSSPGKTRTVNFYIVNKEFRFVDLPGYGYAVASKSDIQKWAEVINEYLYKRENLLEVLLLVDIRHEPTVQDVQMYEWIKASGFVGHIIATKSDKLSKNKINKNIKIIQKKLNLENKDLILPYSSTNKEQVDEAWKIFENYLEN